LERLSVHGLQRGVALKLIESGPVRAWADAGLMGQVVWNLVDNGIKFTPRGGAVELLVRNEGEDAVLEVTDTGVGFATPAEAFERFFREDPARTHGTATAGTGLGLAIVRAAAEAHGGKATAENRPGGGARVSVRIPARF
jgi:signal transduction histidine kinase